ncbi:MAG: YihA family ribosome biogenesis GTP-binding protein [Firmicutes bacterium]|nr:YihA family ribosome biogenesis GTP-binding protein [Bacillota bacterium]
MKINKVKFEISAASPGQFPRDGLPEIAFVGRSNVGKSSLLNNLVRRRDLARVSKTPGKTRLINFFRLDDCCYFVDLPGYGYAKVPKAMQIEWAHLLENYLEHRRELVGVVQLVDLRHPPTADDCQMLAWLTAFQIPVIVVGTKADKISRGRRRQQEKQVAEVLQLPPEIPLVSYSSPSSLGRGELLGLLKGWVTP